MLTILILNMISRINRITWVWRMHKKERDSLLYLFHAFQKKNAAIITKTKPVIPLTLLCDNIMLAESTVVSMASRAHFVCVSASVF